MLITVDGNVSRGLKHIDERLVRAQDQELSHNVMKMTQKKKRKSFTLSAFQTVAESVSVSAKETIMFVFVLIGLFVFVSGLSC